MKTAVFFLLIAAVELLNAGCAIMQVAPAIPDLVSSLKTTHEISFAVIYGDVERRRFDSAEAGIQKLEREFPMSPLVLSECAYIRALIEERKGNTTAALAKYQAIITEHPNTPDAYLAGKKIGRLVKSASAAPNPP